MFSTWTFDLTLNLLKTRLLVWCVTAVGRSVAVVSPVMMLVSVPDELDSSLAEEVPVALVEVDGDVGSWSITVAVDGHHSHCDKSCTCIGDGVTSGELVSLFVEITIDEPPGETVTRCGIAETLALTSGCDGMCDVTDSAAGS